MKGESAYYMEETASETEGALRRSVVHELNGHFLFNALTVIMVVTQEEPVQARALQREFGNYLRGAINQAGSAPEWILLAEEMKMIRAYLYIQDVRFMERINYEFALQDEQVLVPSGILRGLVENAVEHGVCQQPGEGRICIAQKIQKDMQYFYVTDDGVGFDTGILKRQTLGGIERACRVLERIQGARLKVSSRLGKGTQAELILPLCYGNAADIHCRKAGNRK